MLRRVFPLVMAAALAAMATNGVLAAGLTTEQIVAGAYQVDGGRDGISRLSFTFHKSNAAPKKLIYTMAWKGYGGEGGLDSKLLFFSEYPPGDQGKAFLGYLYSDGRVDDHWLYLPDLRMVRKMNHDMHEHHREADEFAPSDLTRGDLVPRAPTADRHRLVGEQAIDGRAYYVVESVPNDRDDENYPYSKVVKWIGKDDFLTERIDYYRGGDQVAKRQSIKWKKIGKYRVWERVVGEDFTNGSRTVLDISDIRVDVGLKDQVFSTRSLRNGIESVLR